MCVTLGNVFHVRDGRGNTKAVAASTYRSMRLGEAVDEKGDGHHCRTPVPPKPEFVSSLEGCSVRKRVRHTCGHVVQSSLCTRPGLRRRGCLHGFISLPPQRKSGSLSDLDGYYIKKCVLTHTVRTHVQHFIRRRITEDVMDLNRALVLVFGGQIWLWQGPRFRGGPATR